MRLINIHTMGMEEFFDEETPPYAILSHRWGKQEISFEQYIKDYELRGLDILNDEREGYKKIKGLCNVARRYRDWFLAPQAHERVPTGLRFVWIDTCCIDKRSSSELSEAVNSMYRWYRDAAFCCAYLSDVRVGEDIEARDCVTQGARGYYWQPAHRDYLVKVQESQWFTRGWTLQELVGSSLILFFDASWRHFAHKCELSTDHVFQQLSLDQSDFHNFQQDVHCGADGVLPTLHMNELIAAWCGIDVDVLLSPEKVFQQSLASRMSWASSRKTTRVEDMAYCMLGVFDINMPLLYGEGRKAFKRLQEEIIKVSTDETIFAWFSEAGHCSSRNHGDAIPGFDITLLYVFPKTCSCNMSAHDGILAPEISCFRFCSGLSPLLEQPHRSSEYIVGQRGLRLHAAARKFNLSDGSEGWGIPLRCLDLNHGYTSKDILVPERRTFEWFYHGQFLDSGLTPVAIDLEQRCRHRRDGTLDQFASTRIERALFGTIPVLILKTDDGKSYRRAGIVEVISWRYHIDNGNLEDKVFFVKL